VTPDCQFAHQIYRDLSGSASIVQSDGTAQQCSGAHRPDFTAITEVNVSKTGFHCNPISDVADSSYVLATTHHFLSLSYATMCASLAHTASSLIERNINGTIVALSDIKCGQLTLPFPGALVKTTRAKVSLKCFDNRLVIDGTARAKDFPSAWAVTPDSVLSLGLPVSISPEKHEIEIPENTEGQLDSNNGVLLSLAALSGQPDASGQLAADNGGTTENTGSGGGTPVAAYMDLGGHALPAVSVQLGEPFEIHFQSVA